MEFLRISLHFWQPSAITMEAMDIDACQGHIQQPGHHQIKWILHFVFCYCYSRCKFLIL